MKTIWKYRLDVADETSVEMPVGAKVITARDQGSDICVWALVDQGQVQMRAKTFVVVPTGRLIDERGLHYVGTAYIRGGTLVFHVFERVGEEEILMDILGTAAQVASSNGGSTPSSSRLAEKSLSRRAWKNKAWKRSSDEL